MWAAHNTWVCMCVSNTHIHICVCVLATHAHRAGGAAQPATTRVGGADVSRREGPIKSIHILIGRVAKVNKMYSHVHGNQIKY